MFDNLVGFITGKKAAGPLVTFHAKARPVIFLRFRMFITLFPRLHGVPFPAADTVVVVEHNLSSQTYPSKTISDHL